MKRRQSECFRNLDDPLKIFSLLTFKSCGLVLLFYAGAVATELLFGALLAYTERHDDEHLVPSAIRYYASRRWRVLYGGARADQYVGHPLEGLVEGGPWRR